MSIRPLALLATLVCLALPCRAADSYVPGTEDVPLAPGLTAQAGEALVFDDPAGRIVQAGASGQGDGAAIRQFYAQTLPQLGWTQLGEGRWTRQGEQLDIQIDRRGGHLSVQFQLSPHTAH